MVGRLAGLAVYLLLALFGPAATSAAPPKVAKPAAPCTPPESAECRHAKGVLWKIEREGQVPSYLFGTIHLADPRITNLPTPVQEAFDAAKSFSMELIFDGAGLTHMAESMFFNDDRTLEGIIGKDRYAQIGTLLKERGQPIGDLNKKKPWVVIMMLGTPRKGGVALDFQLQMRATLQDKPTYGLEKMQEQIDVFNGMSMPDQVALLTAALRHENMTPDMLEGMVQIYLARDLKRLMAMLNMPEGSADERRLNETLMNRLLADRNVVMVERMQQRLVEGNAFIAVGAGHLPGPRGLLVLLEKAGYRVSPVY